MLESLGISPEVKGQMALMNTEAKRNLIRQHSQVERQAIRKIDDTPQAWTHKLRSEASTALFRKLKVVLGGEPIQWLSKFIELEGVNLIAKQLSEAEKKRQFCSFLFFGNTTDNT